MLQTLCQEIARMHPNSILFFYLFKQPKEAILSILPRYGVGTGQSK